MRNIWNQCREWCVAKFAREKRAADKHSDADEKEWDDFCKTLWGLNLKK